MSRSPWSKAIRWPLWSWRNLAATAVLVLVVLAALGRLTDGQGASAASSADSPRTAQVPSTSTGAGHPTQTEPSAASTSPPSPSASTSSRTDASSPVSVAEAFVTAWAHTTGGETAWLAGMKPWATAALVGSLTGTDPAQVPASRVTGDAALTSTEGSSASVSVPTDGGRIAVGLVSQAGGWKASSLAPDDAPPGAPTPSLGPAPASTPSSSAGG
jgi:hypothetical protein